MSLLQKAWEWFLDLLTGPLPEIQEYERLERDAPTSAYRQIADVPDYEPPPVVIVEPPAVGPIPATGPRRAPPPPPPPPKIVWE